jgi:hypothetical protein
MDFPYVKKLALPVIGLEAEFKTFVDGEEVIPEEYWRTPSAFIGRKLMLRTSKSLQLPTGGALYFDGGVIEVVTPVIEIAPECTARAVRSIWEQLGFVRGQLDEWEAGSGHEVRLQAFSCHCNISFEPSREERGRNRTIQKLAMLLAHLLPVPVIVAGLNRRSTGIGVRPRRDRIEITLDFTPDPGLMSATVALIAGITREVIAWPSYRLDMLDDIPRIADVEPGRHPSRNGWVTRDYHFPRNPFTTPIDDPVWTTTNGETISLRAIALRIALRFRDSIRIHSDPFSYRLLFSMLRGETPSLLDLPDRPAEYDDAGRSTRWGSVLPELENFLTLMPERPRRRIADIDHELAPPWRGGTADRRAKNRRSSERRAAIPTPSRRLTRSAYEKVIINVANGRPLQIDGETLTPVAVKGWYHALFRTETGEERLLSIDQLLTLGSKSAPAFDPQRGRG